MLASQKIQFHTKTLLDFKENLRICSRTLSLQQVFLEPFHRPTHPTFKFCHRRLSNLLILLLRHGKMKMISPRFATDDRRAVLGQWPWKKGMQYQFDIYVLHIIMNTIWIICCDQYHSTSRKYMKLAPSCPYWSCTLCPMHLRSRQKSSF